MLESRPETNHQLTAEGDELTTDPNEPFIELRIPPDPAYVRVARLAAGDMGGRVGFSVDEIDDVRLAVDEVCAILIGAGGHVLELRMQAQDRTLVIEGSTPECDATRSHRRTCPRCSFVRSSTRASSRPVDATCCFEMHKQAREIA